MDTDKAKNSKGKAKLLATTGAICAMGGYICGNTIDESNRLDELSRPYEVADSIMYNVERKQSEWFAEKERILSENLFYRFKFDSLSRIAKNFDECQETVEEKNSEIQQCTDTLAQAQNEREQYKNAYGNEQNEVRIRDDQIDSLENLAKQLAGKIKEIQDEYKNRAPVENEFQAIHNCINAHGNPMSSHEFERQAKCCIKALKKLQNKYPNETFENINVSCSDNGHGYR